MSTWKGRKTFPPSVKATVLRRNPVCVGCHARQSTEVDHVIPMAEGGTHTIDNAQALCSICHETKTKKERKRGIDRYNKTRQRQSRGKGKHPGLLD